MCDTLFTDNILFLTPYFSTYCARGGLEDEVLMKHLKKGSVQQTEGSCDNVTLYLQTANNFIHIHTHMYIYIYMHIYMYIYMHIYVYICAYTWMCDTLFADNKSFLTPYLQTTHHF